MTAHRIVSVALLLAGTLSCSEATAPSRVPNYEWRLFVENDTLSFHWPASALPVRIWVEDTLDMPDRIGEGIATWTAALLYGEYDAVIVADSTLADVLVRVKLPPGKAMLTAARLHTTFESCEGATDIDTVATRYQLQLPVRMYLYPRYDPAQVDLTECFQAVARHELGHSLGLFQHSGDMADIMYGLPEAAGLSVRDINTAQIVAHWPANMIPTR